MKANSKLAAVAVVSALAGATFLGANSVSAQASGRSIVERISERFNVSEVEVQEVLDEYKAEQQVEHEAARAEHLDDLVASNVLTDEQRSELEAFGEQRRELKDELRAQDLTKQEMREAMEGMRAEVEAWAEAEGIELDDIRPERGNKREHRREHKQELREIIETEFGEAEEAN